MLDCRSGFVLHAGKKPCKPILFRLSFALENVDDFVAARAHDFNKDQQVVAPSRKQFNINQLGSTKFHKFQQGMESGSGPGGWRFKSSLPDHSFQSDKRNFWFSVYTAVDDFVTVKSHTRKLASALRAATRPYEQTLMRFPIMYTALNARSRLFECFLIRWRRGKNEVVIPGMETLHRGGKLLRGHVRAKTDR